jgi:hypothetical protein
MWCVGLRQLAVHASSWEGTTVSPQYAMAASVTIEQRAGEPAGCILSSVFCAAVQQAGCAPALLVSQQKQSQHTRQQQQQCT